MPYGRGPINEQALAHYDDVINTCLSYGVEPIVTLYHWDLPLYLQILYGGWLSEEIVSDFVTYAKVVFSRYQDRVSRWFTVNEPIVFCNTYPLPTGYFPSVDIPAKQQPYFCGQSVLLAHSQAYHAGKAINSSLSISFKTNGGYKIPLTNSSADLQATQRAWDFNEGWFANPIFLNGSYPSSLNDYVSGFLRPLNSSEQQNIVNTSDVFAHDAYTSQFYFAPDSGIDACVKNSSHPLYPSCANTSYTYPDSDGGWNIGFAADPLSPWLVSPVFTISNPPLSLHLAPYLHPCKTFSNISLFSSTKQQTGSLPSCTTSKTPGTRPAASPSQKLVSANPSKPQNNSSATSVSTSPVQPITTTIWKRY